jgi:hypothetical protein
MGKMQILFSPKVRIFLEMNRALFILPQEGMA